MNLPKLSFYARKVHRLTLLFIVVLGFLQLVTGLAMKYPSWFGFLDQGTVRVLHFDLAGWFGLVFGIQMLTGIIMYVVPMLIRKSQQNKQTPPQTV